MSDSYFEAGDPTMDCGDNSCIFAESKGGMRTNGGCRCLENTLLTRVQARDVRRRVLSLAQGKRQLEREIAAKDAGIARLDKELAEARAQLNDEARCRHVEGLLRGAGIVTIEVFDGHCYAYKLGRVAPDATTDTLWAAIERLGEGK